MASWLESEGRFEELYSSNSEELLVFLARRVLDAQAALDLTAETFAKAFLGRGRFRGAEAETARAWLYGIARHELSHFHRRGAAERRAIERLAIEVPELSEEEHRRVEERADVDSIRKAVRSGLDDISADHREALRLRVVEERSYPDVATSLGISEQAARARVSRGLRALGKALELTDDRQEGIA